MKQTMNKLLSPREELALLATIIHASRSVKGMTWCKAESPEETYKPEARLCVGIALAIILEAEKIE